MQGPVENWAMANCKKEEKNIYMHGNRWKYYNSQNIYKTAHLCGDNKENEEKIEG